jgi:hypothetical protein
LGVRALYDSEGVGVFLRIGPVQLKVYHGRGEKKEKNNSQEKTSAKSVKKKASGKGESRHQKGGSLRDFETILREVISFLVKLKCWAVFRDSRFVF